MKRQVIPLNPSFFCDGHWYILTSSSLGGSDLTPSQLSDILCQDQPEAINKLLDQGICLPLFFDGDCALDNAIFIIGDLTPPEEQEWIGKLTWKLNIPCGKIVLICGGADPDDIALAISGEKPDPHYQIFQMIDLPSGEYLVEIYAYVSSMTVNFYFDEDNPQFQQDEPLENWFKRTRPNVELPLWLKYFQEYGYIGDLSEKLVDYLIRLKPLDQELKNPPIVPDIGWCGKFQLRRPEICPLGLSRSHYIP